MERAQREVELIEAQIEDIETGLEQTDIIDAVRLVDDEAATRLEALSRIVNDENLPEPQRQSADLEAAAIIERTGAERVAKALNDSEIGPRKELQTLRKRRKAAVRRYKKAYAAVEAERGKLQAASDRIKELQRGETTDLLGNALGGKPVLGSQMSHGVVARQAQIIDEVHEAIEETGERLVRDVADEETIDIGLAERVDPNFRYVDGDGNDVSFRQVI